MHPYRLCDHCKKPRPPEGGCQLRSVRWICSACWIGSQRGRRSLLRKASGWSAPAAAVLPTMLRMLMNSYLH